MALIADPLDDALSSRAKARLLRLQIGEPQPMSACKAACSVGMAKRSADLGLRDPVQAGIVSRLGGREERAISDLFETLRDAVEVPDPAVVLWAVLFGSTASGQDDLASDIDLGIIVRDKEAIRPMQERLVGRLPIVRRRFGHVLSPVIMSREQLAALPLHGRALVGEPSNIWRSAAAPS